MSVRPPTHVAVWQNPFGTQDLRRSGYLVLIVSCLCMKLPDKGIVWGVVKWGLFQIRLKKQNPS